MIGGKHLACNLRTVQPMKLLVVSQYYWPENFRINEVAQALAAKGIAVEVLTGKPNYPGGKMFEGYRISGIQHEHHNGVSIHRLPLLPRRSGAAWLAINYLSFMLVGLLLAPFILRKRSFDVIFVYGTSPIIQAIPAIFLGWLTRRPVILWVQDLWPDSLRATGHVTNKRALKSVGRVVRFIYDHVDLLLVQSAGFIAPVRSLTSNKNIHYYPNSVGDEFKSSYTSTPHPITKTFSGFTVLFAGNIGVAQAVEVIIGAATLLRDEAQIKFVILGDGSKRAWMLNEVVARNLTNVSLPGKFPTEAMPGFMQAASALLVTLTDHEIFAQTVPNKVQAYMAVGRPIIACLRGEGARLVVEAGAGLAVPAEDAAALAAAVLTLRDLPASALEEMGENGRRYFGENFDQEVLTLQLISHLTVLSENGG